MSALDSAHGAKYTPPPPPPPARHVRFLTVPLLRDAMRCHATPCGQIRYVMLCYGMQTQWYAMICHAMTMLCYACFGAGMFRMCGMFEQLLRSPYHPRPPAALPSAWPASPLDSSPPFISRGRVGSKRSRGPAVPRSRFHGRRLLHPPRWGGRLDAMCGAWLVSTSQQIPMAFGPWQRRRSTQRHRMDERRNPDHRYDLGMSRYVLGRSRPIVDRRYSE